MPEDSTRGPWAIDIGARTVTHHEGWQFQLWPSTEEPGTYGCACVLVPPSAAGDGRKVERQTALTCEAGQAFLDALATAEQGA